jgi:tripartite-type tricarboxylate transporter receptor subunit TctC
MHYYFHKSRPKPNEAEENMIRALGLWIAASALALSGAPALAAEAWPARPIRVIVPFPPGGSNDIVARLVGNHLTERLGKTVVVDNRGGAGGRIGYETAASARPDGYTLLIISVAYTFTPALYQLNFDANKAFVPVAMLGTGANALAVYPGLGANSVKELVAMAKARPGQLNYANAGVGSFQHLGSELFRIMAGINIVGVPYKGGGPATLSVVAGESQISIGSLIQTLPHVRPGRLKLLGTGGAKRVAIVPDVPTIAEAGVPGYEASNWWGIVAPAGTPAAITQRLSKEITEIIASPEVQKWFASEGAEAATRTPAEFQKLIASEIAKWGKVVKQAGIKAES